MNGLLLAPTAWSKTWHISNDGSGDAPNIQAGVDSAGAGDTVLVGPGTYYENVDSVGFGGRVVLMSMLGAESTIIDGGQSGSVLHVIGGATILGFTIQNGLAENGGGISVEPVTGPAIYEIRRNIIANNWAGLAGDQGNGGGLYFSTGLAGTITGNVFKDNYAGDSGGGIYLTIIRNVVVGNEFIGNGCHVGGGGLSGFADTLRSNLFVGNWSDSFGGAIYGSGFLIKNNTIVLNYINNAAFAQGAGLHVGGGNTLIENNIVALNYGPRHDTGVGIKCASQFGTVTVRCNDVWGNDFDYEVLVGCDTTGLSNISLDPQFCGLETGDFTLRASSPCAPEGASGCGLIGRFPVACQSVSTRRATWGRLKGRYGTIRD